MIKKRPKPFARSETVEEKKLFSGLKHKRCLIPASGFFEKKYRIRKKNYETFWLGGIWSKWTSPDGDELESCCILTTEPNSLIRPLHNRMPVVIPEKYEEQWTEQVKDIDELKGLLPIMMGWSPDGWMAEEVVKDFKSNALILKGFFPSQKYFFFINFNLFSNQIKLT